MGTAVIKLHQRSHVRKEPPWEQHPSVNLPSKTDVIYYNVYIRYVNNKCAAVRAAFKRQQYQAASKQPCPRARQTH